MSYIAFELDALNVCPQVGAACGLSAAEAAHGLLQLWAWCFRTEQATATDVHLRGFFHGKDAGPALEAFGFLERMEGWRVRGAERYLRVKEAQRAGGRKGAKNLRRGKSKKAAPEAVQPEVDLRVDLRVDLGSTSGTTSGASPALTPSTEHRAPNTEVKSVAPDGARQALIEALCVAFERETGARYPFSSRTDPHVGARNGKAVKALSGMGVAPTVVAIWSRALRETGFPKVRTLPELVTNWAHFVGDVASTGPPGTQLGIIARPLELCAVCGAGAIGSFATIAVCTTHFAQAEHEGRRLKPDAPWTADLSGWVNSQHTEVAP